MGKIITENQNDTIVLFNQIAKTEDVNGREMDFITKHAADVFLPVDFTMQKNDRYLRCAAVNCVPLGNFLQLPLGKKSFFDMILRIVSMLKLCEQHSMKIKNMEMNFDRVFVNTKTQDLQFVYWPLVNAQASVDLVAFLMEIAYKAVFAKDENSAYVMEYIHYLKTHMPFSVNHFERFISGQTGVQSTGGDPYASGAIDLSGGSSSVAGNAARDIAYTPNYGSAQPTYEPTIHQPAVQTPLSSSTTGLQPRKDEDTDKTSFLGVGAFNQRVVFLLWDRTGEKIMITNQFYKIGTNKDKSDYVITGNKTVSRHHASIITETGRYYIMDNGSTNKTYVNGNLLPAHQKIEITAGARIRMSNEDFTFRVE